MPDPGLSVRLLGTPMIEFGADSRALSTDRRHLLLAFLACQADWVDRARVARLFWPEHDVGDARHNLRQLIKRVRAWSFGGGLESATDPGGERLRWLVPTDLAALRSALADGRWADAITLHGGPFLASLDLDALPAIAAWAEWQRSTIEETTRRSLVDRAAALEDVGEDASAARVYGHLIAVDDLDEAAVRAFLSACFATGQRAEGLVAYRRFAVRLAEELDLTPAAATTALAQRLRAHDVAPARSDASECLGRDTEIGQVQRLFSLAEVRLVTITGPGGVGKSALARRIAADLGSEFDDGVIIVEFGATPDARGLVDRVAAHPDLASRAALDAATSIGDRRLLLVLDDLDDLRDEADDVSKLLSRCPNLVVLATSRERLGTSEEWLVPLDGLACPEASATEDETLAAPAVRLFLSRLERVRPGHQPTPAELHEAGRLCRLVAGLPLAIELAAARGHTLPVSTIADELRDGLDVLDGGRPGEVSRRTSMRASIEASCRRVPERELDYWLALSVFRGPFDRVAASRVTGGRGPLLTSLVDRSLVAAGPSGSYSLLPLLRTYAAERLAEDEGRLAALNWRHAEYFFDLVEQVREPMGYERPAAVRALTVGLDDVRAALLWVVETLFIPGAERRATSQQVAGWCAALMQVCEDNAWFGHAADTFGQVSDALARGGSSALRGATLAYRGWHLLRQSRPTEADAAAVYALELLTGEPGTAAFRTALQVRAGVALHEGRFADSVELFSRALDSARAVTPLTVTAKREVARVTGNLGVAKQLLGDRHGAVRDFWRQLAILRGTGDLAASAAVYSNLGNVLRLLKRGDEAYDALQAALRLATGFDQFALLPSLNVNLGVLYRERGEIEEARRHFEAAASLAEGQGRRALVVTATFQLGRLDLLGGELVEARRAFAAAHDLASETGGVSGALDALAGLAWVAFFEGDMAAAVEMAATVSSNLATSPGTRHWMEELKAVLPSDGGTTVPATRSRRVVTTMRA